jgi:hypothetical protein
MIFRRRLQTMEFPTHSTKSAEENCTRTLRRKQYFYFLPMIRNNFRYLPKDEAQPRNTSHWSVDENYNRTREEVFPVRATSTADNLYLTLHSPANDVNPACAQQKGFKILFHHPAEIPTSSTDYIVLARDEAYNIKLIPDVTVTASTLINYEPHKRGCFFSHEKTLKFYKTYTERNCKLECLANYTLQHCKCVSYYLPSNVASLQK